MAKDYYLGLDMGTSSVGWAVTDEAYNLLRAKGKDMWGIREFEEASTATDRRTNRISRRRRERELAREGYLKMFFDEEIRKIDPDFFARLENSKYFVEDKDECVRYKAAIFNDKNYTDKDYYGEYPTIFHLRKAMIENNCSFDVRLVYLAIHNMFKHRGHFLNENLDESVNVTDLSEQLSTFYRLATEIIGIHLEEASEGAIKAVFARKDISRSKKAEELSNLFGIDKVSKEFKSRAALLPKAICGLSVDYVKVFNIQSEEDKKAEISFGKSDFDEKIPEIYTLIGEENAELLDSMKAIYDIGTLATILGDYDYLSFARVDSYEKHHSDLRKLKDIIIRYVPDKFDDLFRNEVDGSYSAYVKSTNSKNVKGRDGLTHNRRGAKGRKASDLYDTLKKILKPFSEEEDVKEILNDIANENFLPKQLTSANGVIPNQVHLKELKKILSNAEEFLPFLKKTDETGLSVSEKIIKLFEFHMPYYIGPVSQDDKCKGWAVRKENGTVLPWNLEQKIDVNKTSEKFITNLIRECTYLSGEKVMPKTSLLYEKYCVLNEINNIKIRGNRIDPETKKGIYVSLFETGKRVTRSKLFNYLKTKDKSIVESDISGIDNNINNALTSYGKFLNIFGEKMKLDTYKKLAEDIVYYGTIYGDDKKRFKSILVENFADSLSDDEIKRISGMKFKDWGRFSKAFLELQGCDTETGEVKSLIQTLWDTNLNMMEIINSDRFSFAEALEEKKKKIDKSLCEFTFEDLDEYYFAPPVKRMMWQTLQLIKEIQKVNGSAPKTIFLEMTRSDEEKGDRGRKNSREKDLLELYKSVKDDTHNWNELIKKEGETGRLKSKKVYLYIKQMGRDMYTGKPIDFDHLMDDNLYDIDHIYPRQFTTDNNIENNLVLVAKQVNAEKTNNYPLDSKIRNNPEVYNLWKTLHEKDLINDEKYYRLTRNTPFTEDEQAKFIARQIVETSQGTKGIADLLKYLLPDTNIVYSKASNVSKFRDKYDLVKCRSLNDLHHAHDAYLNIVVGNVYDTKFTQNPMRFIKDEYLKDKAKYHYNLEKMFDWDVVRNGKVAWRAPEKDGDEMGTIVTVKKVLNRATPLMTRMSLEGHGGIANATLYSADEAKTDTYIPLKSSDSKLKDMSKYGGYTSVSTAYFFLVEHEVKGKKIRTIESLPIYKKVQVEKSKDGLLNYCINELGLKNPSIRVKKIKLQSLLKLNNYFVYLSGRSDNRLLLYNATNMVLDIKYTQYVKQVEKVVDSKKVESFIECDKNISLYDEICHKYSETIFSNRPQSIKETLVSKKTCFESLNLMEQCEILAEIIKATRIGSVPGVNLALIGGSSKTGIMRINKSLSMGDLYLVEQSITGLFEKKINLLTV